MCVMFSFAHKFSLTSGLAPTGELLSVSSQKVTKDRGPQEAVLLGVQYRGSFHPLGQLLVKLTTDSTTPHTKTNTVCFSIRQTSLIA